MDLWVILTLHFLFLTVPTTVCEKKITKDFDCCQLPYQIPIEPSHENEFFIGHKSLAIATESYFEAESPFTVLGNTSLTLEKCEDFYQKTFFMNKFGYTEEMMTHHRSQPCNKQQGRGRIGIVITAVLALGLGVIGVVVCCWKNTMSSSLPTFHPETTPLSTA